MSPKGPQQPDSPDHGLGRLDPQSYTARRLAHASPEHLNLTTRRFFIGPIPEGWLNSNRKSWYKRSLKQRATTASFTAQTTTTHQRAGTSLEGPFAPGTIGFSFPQSADVQDEGYRGSSAVVSEVGGEENYQEDTSRGSNPVAGAQIPQVVGTPASDGARSPKMLKIPRKQSGLAPVGGSDGNLEAGSESQLGTSPGQETFVTARERMNSDEIVPTTSQDSGEQPSAFVSNLEEQNTVDDRPSTSQQDGSQPESSNVDGEASSDPGQTTSTTALVPPVDRHAASKASIASQLPLSTYDPAPLSDRESQPARPRRTDTRGVRFALAEGVMTGQERLKRKIDGVQKRAIMANFHQSPLRDGAIVTMEKMLVRTEITKQAVSEDYDENTSLGTQTRVVEKWQEFIVVLRRSRHDEADSRLQLYKSRTIPEIENDQVKQKPHREITLSRRTARINLYSSLDKTLVLWHPYKKGTRIMIMRPKSTAHSVGWYTLLKDTLGWERPSALQVNVPDLSVSLRLERPFEGLETTRKSLGNAEDAAALALVTAEEQAIARKMIQQCFTMLLANAEWAEVLDTWSRTEKMGLAWKRYDRLEWIHGANERKMYGSMALQKSHELELRPKKHYPNHIYDKTRKPCEEPAPLEGFLVRLTTQTSMARYLGSASYKRLYFSTHNQFLVFNKPSKVTPPPPPGLAAIPGTNIPSSSEIINGTPTMFEVAPFQVRDGAIPWVRDPTAAVQDHDRKACEESQRNLDNLSLCDGFINLCRVVKVRKMRWGATSVDGELDSGSDVDFHQEVTDTRQEDGTTSTVDDSRTFELVMDNDLIVRLQAYNNETMKEWMRRLRALVKYWKLRINSDINTLKMVRATNLEILNIDEQMEAKVGQFARKWEVSRCQASPELYNMCGISSCRTIVMSGMLYRKPRRNASFTRCSVILANGALMMFQASSRTMTGKQIPFTHQEKHDSVDLRNCYIYSGLITADDLLYTNRTFDSNNPGSYALPRLYLEHGWTSIDEDTMTTFVIWHGLRRSLFRARRPSTANSRRSTSRLPQVSRLGRPGRAIVFKCRSRAERDHWVMNIAMEIDRLQQDDDDDNVRVERSQP